MAASGSHNQLAPLPMEEEEPEMERELPAILHRRHRWVSPATEKRIETAWGPKGRRQVCQVCQEEHLSHRSLKLHVNTHFLLNFCPCGYHNVYPYPITVHKMNCFAGENHVVDEDAFSEYLAIIRPSVKKALTSGFQIILKQFPMVSSKPDPTPVSEPLERAEGAIVPSPARISTPGEAHQTSHSRRTFPATTGRLHTISARPAEYNHRFIST